LRLCWRRRGIIIGTDRHRANRAHCSKNCGQEHLCKEFGSGRGTHVRQIPRWSDNSMYSPGVRRKRVFADLLALRSSSMYQASGGAPGHHRYQSPTSRLRAEAARCLVHPWCLLVADLDRLSTLDVADHPSWFEDNPRVGLCCAGRAALRYLPPADEQENVIVLILVNLANRCFVTHALPCSP